MRGGVSGFRGFGAAGAAEDLRRKDFIAIHRPPLGRALGPGFVDLAAERMRAARGFVRFLCESLDVPF